MRALTLTQPWAGLVASGVKLVENRPRAMIKQIDFGVPFAVHASREIDESVYATIERIWPPGSPDPAGGRPRWYQLSRITSAVIAVATIERAVSEFSALEARTSDAYDLHSGAPVDLGYQRRFFFGPVGYVLRDVRALAEPVPCKGALGFWTLPDDVAARVTAQLGGSR